MSKDLPKTKDIVCGAFEIVKLYSNQANDLPFDDYDYHMAFPGFRQQVKKHSDFLVELMNKCCHLLPARRRVALHSSTGALKDQQRTAVMEAVDSLLENVDALLDDLNGQRLNASDQLSFTFGSELQNTLGLTSEGRVLRPQLTFEHPVDNSDAPFCPVYYDAHGVRHSAEAGRHPFSELIQSASIPEDQLLRCTEIPYLPLAVCPLRFVDTVSDLGDVVKVLLQEKEIAIDLEHHDFYSYQGFTCLMQISTRKEDFIIDCLKLRSSMHMLSSVFLHDRILKVLHGAREDVRWLQKDFGLYLVNFFDTGIALQTLHMPHSLAFAVDHFCQVKLNKKYQTADWRVRPIPAEMVAYARQDTHFLLYVYDRLKSLLLNSESRASVGNLLVHVLKESRRLSLELYEKPKLDPDTTYKIALGRSLGGLTAPQLQVAREVFNWRDSAAREVDDSPAAVMHLSSVLAIASKLPTSANELLRCCSPVSVTTRTSVMKLLNIVKEAVGSVSEETRKEDNVNLSNKQTLVSAAALARPVGIHRSMTGTLPSLERHSNAATRATIDGALQAVVVHTKPSEWLMAMRRLAAVLRERQVPEVAIPGQEIVALMAQSMSTSIQRRESENEEHMEEPIPDDNVPDVQWSKNEFTELAEEQEQEHEHEAEPEKKKSVVEVGGERAVALRQKYGTGSANRKKVKTGKTNTNKRN